MSYLAPDHQPNLLTIFEVKKEAEKLVIHKDLLLSIVENNPKLTKSLWVLKASTLSLRLNDLNYKSTVFLYSDEYMPQISDFTDIENCMEFIQAYTLPIVVSFDDLKKCNGCMVKTNNPKRDMYVLYKNSKVYINGVVYNVVKSIKGDNGYIHVLGKQ